MVGFCASYRLGTAGVSTEGTQPDLKPESHTRTAPHISGAVHEPFLYHERTQKNPQV